jgi:NADH dehydrogenase
VNLFVTGASSFVGAHFCARAVARGHRVTGLWRNTRLSLPGVDAIRGEVQAISPVAGTEVVVHLAMQVFARDAPARNGAMLDAVLGWKLPVAYGSSTTVHWPVKSAYARSRAEDESRLLASGLPVAIVRPCAPYGPPLPGHTPAHRESFHRLAAICRRAPILPIPGDGRYRRQPVHVHDFADAILALIENGTTGAFDAGGPEPIQFRAIVRALGARRILPVPLGAIRPAGFLVGMTPEILATFATDDVCDPRPLEEASGVQPRSFDPAALSADPPWL